MTDQRVFVSPLAWCPPNDMAKSEQSLTTVAFWQLGLKVIISKNA